MIQIWKPHVTVAAIIERAGKFLLVEEKISGQVYYNQPAGHLEKNETLPEAIAREVMEETAHAFIPQFLVGIYHWYNKNNDVTFVRLTFGGDVTGHDPDRPLDKEIIATHWLSPGQINALGSQLRSPMVKQGFDDWQTGKRYPLQLISHLG